MTAIGQTQESPLVLLVEDYPDTRELYRHVLTARGYRVEEAEDGAQAIGKARALRPALILMDLSLPEVDGWTATRILKSEPATATVPIIIVSAHVLAVERRRAYDAGCDAFLTKPCLPRVLVGEVDRVLRLAQDQQHR